MVKKSLIFFAILAAVVAVFFLFPDLFSSEVSYSQGEEVVKIAPLSNTPPVASSVVPLNKDLYNRKMVELANNHPSKAPTVKITKTKNKDGTFTTSTVTIPPPPEKPHLWPVKAPYPNAGALLPFNRIIAYYGNLYSTKMGVLGEYPEAQMLAKLETEVKKWEIVDPSTPVIPALHYIAVVAQGAPGDSGKYRLRMPDSEINKVLAMAAKINAIVFLDIQDGFSNVQTEVPLLEKYLKMPNVHLALDPEFSMKSGIRPGKVVGTMDASDINFASTYLANLVKTNNLTPKILIVHRYTQKMMTNYKEIKTTPEVQLIMNMDGWGGQAKKIGTYKNFIYPEPVQFTGFKLFYKNDLLTPGSTLMSPETLLKLNPRPIYIQYQ